MHPSACSSSCLVAFLPRQFERAGGMCEYIALVTRAAAACVACTFRGRGIRPPARRDPVSPPHFCCQFSVGSFRRGRRRSYITHTHRKLDRICLAARGREGGGRAQFGAHALELGGGGSRRQIAKTFFSFSSKRRRISSSSSIRAYFTPKDLARAVPNCFSLMRFSAAADAGRTIKYTSGSIPPPPIGSHTCTDLMLMMCGWRGRRGRKETSNFSSCHPKMLEGGQMKRRHLRNRQKLSKGFEFVFGFDLLSFISLVSFSPLCKKGCIFRIVRHCNKAFKMHADAFTLSIKFFLLLRGEMRSCILLPIVLYSSIPRPWRWGSVRGNSSLSFFFASIIPAVDENLRRNMFCRKRGAFSAFILSTNFFDILGTRRFFVMYCVFVEYPLLS